MQPRVVGQLRDGTRRRGIVPRARAPDGRRPRRAPRRPGPTSSTHGARMKTARTGSSSPDDVEVGLERRDLPAERVAADRRRRRARGGCGRARSSPRRCRRRAGRSGDRLVEPVEAHQAHERRRLAAGDHQPVEPVELLRLAHLDRVARRAAAASARARGSFPARRERRSEAAPWGNGIRAAFSAPAQGADDRAEAKSAWSASCGAWPKSRSPRGQSPGHGSTSHAPGSDPRTRPAQACPSRASSGADVAALDPLRAALAHEALEMRERLGRREAAVASARGRARRARARRRTPRAARRRARRRCRRAARDGAR